MQIVELVDMLLKSGANPNPTWTCCDSYPCVLKHELPLFVAIEKRNSGIAMLLLNAGANVNAVNADGKNIMCFAAETLIDLYYGRSTEEVRKALSTIHLLIQHGANFSMQMPKGCSSLYSVFHVIPEVRNPQKRHCIIELLQSMLKYGAALQEPSAVLQDIIEVQKSLVALATFDGSHAFIVDLFRAEVRHQLLKFCCNAIATHLQQTKSISLCQAAVLAGYMPSARELRKLQLAAARDNTSDHQIQQLVNWLNKDRQQVPSLLRQCRVVIRRQLSVAVHFQSILPAIDKLPLPTTLKLYLQFDGPKTEVDL